MACTKPCELITFVLLCHKVCFPFVIYVSGLVYCFHDNLHNKQNGNFSALHTAHFQIERKNDKSIVSSLHITTCTKWCSCIIHVYMHVYMSLWHHEKHSLCSSIHWISDKNLSTYIRQNTHACAFHFMMWLCEYALRSYMHTCPFKYT